MNILRKHFGGFGNRLFQLAFLYSKVRQGHLPDIYLQDYRYFDEFRSELKKIFRERDFTINKVSLHIRRGDYVNNPYYVDLSQTDYYQKAVEEFPDEEFLVFCADRQEGSDDGADRKWCQEFLSKLLPSNRFKFFESKDEERDMQAMINCKGHIMANSSFSFWASYIGEGKTVAPSKWFADGRSIPLPEEFLII